MKIEEFASLDLTPICMAMDPDGRLYVSGLQGNVNAEGVIVRLERPESGGAVTSRTVARGLVRPHGMAFHEGSLYVVRTGQLTTTEGDRIKFVPTGVVTRLTDVDGDGEYDLYRDVLTGLPGAFGLHSVSAITFDDQGYMYVTTPTAGDHSPPLDSKEGQLLRCRPDGSGLTTLARGLRNPYDMIIGPDRQLFCTDNDADELNRGDVIYLVREGDHFGFPYDQLIGGAKVEGITPPIFAPGQGKVLEGLAYAAPGTLPAGYDDCLYVAVLWSDEVLKLGLRKTAEAPGYKAEVLESLPKISRPLDLIVAPREQAIYVLRGYEDKKIDRIVIQ